MVIEPKQRAHSLPFAAKSSNISTDNKCFITSLKGKKVNCQNKKLIAVLGMHRSGTSMVAGILAKLGLHPGADDNLLKPDRYNLKGYFEDNHIVQCNEKMLVDAINIEFSNIHDADCFLDKKTLDGFGWLYGAWLKKTMETNCTAKESSLIKEAFEKYNEGICLSEIGVMKDPRLSVTFKKWSEVVQINAAIVMIRNPAAVAQSLFKRNGIIDILSYNLWQLYTYKALLSIENIPNMVIDYDSLIYNREKVFAAILSFLNSLNYKTDNLQERAALEFIEHKLDHSSQSSNLYPPKRIMDIYDQMKNNRINDLKDKYENCLEIMKEEWLSALYIAAKNKGNTIINDYRGIIDRLNKHIITGNIIELVKKIKKDPSFGNYIQLM